MFKNQKPAAQAASGGDNSVVKGSVFRIKPYHYIHVFDSNTGITNVVLGPKTFTRQEHEKVVLGPETMVIIPPRHYCVVGSPVVRGEDGQPMRSEDGNYLRRHGDEEIRHHATYQDPFPLYPGEELFKTVTPLQIVASDSALRLRCIRDFKDNDIARVAGDEWLFLGPATYFPKVEVQVVEIVRGTVLNPTQGLKLRARRECKDCNGTTRKAGEEWLQRTSGCYLPGVDEEIVETINAFVLTDRQALHLRASRTYVDQFGKTRKAGEEWLVTNAEAHCYIPDVYEDVIGQVAITVLNNRQYCVILDPLNSETGKPQLGKKILIKGESSFFLRPGERLEKGIQNVYVLGDSEALLLRAREAFSDKEESHAPGDRWMIYGPCDYIPPVEVEIVEKRKAIPLSDNEGIYVRDITSGKVRAVIGESYMLKPTEELWEKALPDTIEQLLQKQSGSTRDKSRVVSLRVPRNAAVQIYDYINKKSRVVFGAELVLLDPDEHFTLLSLSGGKPKRPHQIKDLCLQLGPDFMTDIITVETSDHARLNLKLSYNWRFKIAKGDGNETKLFQVPDFVGDACKAMASNIRGAVASVGFDQFHKYSARLIRKAVFGENNEGKINDEFVFEANLLSITNIDIQSVEPVDQRTRDSLQKSVQLAIEITTKSQEATARHEAERIEQEARGRLDRQKIDDEAEAERARTELLKLQATTAALESTGQATAEAKARTEASQIASQAAVQQATLKAESSVIIGESELEAQKKVQETEIEHRRKIDGLEIARASSLASIESSKFKGIISAIGPDTIAAIAQAGPEMQAKLLEGLGIKSLLITDGNSPINLFNTANGLVAGPQQ